MDKKTQFISKLKNIYPAEYENILSALEIRRNTTFRILHEYDDEILSDLKRDGFVFKQCPLPHSYAITGQPYNLSRTNAYENGRIYIQGLASMLAVYTLESEGGQKIIDLCSAPGSKTLLINALTEGRADITAVENNTSRMYAMKANFEKYGAANVKVIKENAVNLQNRTEYIEGYSRVLADVPCSNEGLIRAPAHHDFSTWNPKTSRNIAQLQKKILASGLRLLKYGGMLVYSTCTYSPEENEAVVSWALKKFPEAALLEIAPIPLDCRQGIASYSGKDYNPEVKKTLRILPSEICDAFYLAKFTKCRRGNFPVEGGCR